MDLVDGMTVPVVTKANSFVKKNFNFIILTLNIPFAKSLAYLFIEKEANIFGKKYFRG